MRGRLTVAVAVIAIALVAWPGRDGVGATRHAGNEEAAARAAVPFALPPGWHRARALLVPNLRTPRERVSVGTFSMAPGGGGDCGREPVASIRRMRPGDALVSVQEYALTANMRHRLTRLFPARTTVRLAGRGGGPIHRTTISFRDRGRAFDALVYVAGRPSPQLRDQVDSLLAGLPLPD
jgi:hypothetical protein